MNEQDIKKCPYCGEEINIDAIKCRFCNEWLEKRKNKDTVSQVRPWVRYWARWFDYVLFGLIMGLAIGISGVGEKINEFLLGILVVFLWVFFEAYLISQIGTTPGKWLLKVIVSRKDGEKPTFSEALGRSMDVWIRGVGLGIPIISLATSLAGYNALTKDKMTSWDKEKGFKVMHEKIGWGRVTVFTTLVIGALLLIAVGNTIQ